MSFTERVKEKLDTNKNGIIEAKEVFSKKTLIVILGVVLSVLIDAVLEYLDFAMSDGSWGELTFLDAIKQLIAPIIMLFILRSIMSDMDKETKEKDIQISKAENTIQEQKIENLQKEAIIVLKTSFIDLIWNFVPQDIRDKIQKPEEAT